MRRIPQWTLSLFYFLPVLWFMYVSVELLADRSSSLAAMELAYRLHRQHHRPQDSALNDVLPADRPRLQHLLDEAFPEQREGGGGGGGGGEAGNGRDQGLAAEDLQFQDKLQRFRRHRQGALAADSFRKDNPPGLGGVKDAGRGEDPHVQRGEGGVDMQGGKEEEVQFPPYVEAWGPDLPGEGGKPVHINVTELSPAERQRYQEGWARNSFNQYASDLISVHRSLPDNNPPECVEQRKEYSATLPEVSVIIIFHNEAWSVLLRSVHSVLSRTPSHLLRQVILVDDLSSMDHLKRPLEVYWRREPKVSIVRAPKRVGLTQARLLGYRVATADVLVFLDSHIECFPGWAEPMLHRVQAAPFSTVFPQVDSIRTDNFRVMQNLHSFPLGQFRWRDLSFQWSFWDTASQGKATLPIFIRAGWLQPLAARVQHSPTTTVFPMTETIVDTTLTVIHTPRVNVHGIFRWKDLNFGWGFLSAKDRQRRVSLADPIRSEASPAPPHPCILLRWVEPLLERIVRHPGAVPYPDIEIIYDDTLRVGFTDPGSRAVFRWKDLTFQWEFVPDYEKARRKTKADFIRSPTMPGGLFAISRHFFHRLGTYDPGLEYWGGENIELSFKAWMCNGSVELIPCSHVGHIFRKSNPIKWHGNVGSKNSARVAEVWMDDYKNYFYERINYNAGDFGDVTERKLLRQRLGCHSFDWYLKNVFPNMFVPRHMKFAGEVRNAASLQCLDSMGAMDQLPQLFPCHSQGGNQFWYFSMEGDLYQDGNHICEKDGGLTQMGPCMTGLWQYTQTKTLLHVRSGKCLAGSQGTSAISLQPCNDSAWQTWTMTTRPADRVFP